jgi:hydrogenase maturation protein HypF
MPGYKIHIEGQVQGVGFRPYVYRMAKRLGLTGWVQNGSDGVHIHIGGHEDACRLFLEEIISQPPALARVVRHHVELTEKPEADDFTIIESDDTAEVNLLLTPDLGLCEECRDEIRDAQNRRHEYAFTTCIHCGPRYSIVQSLPYDRANTSMQPFTLCPDCQQEYNNPHDRRYYSQTNSCPHCGITLTLLNNKGEKISSETAQVLDQTVEALHRGEIVAVKGIGGYLLMADACNEIAVHLLRKRKRRPSKPLALLYPSLAHAEEDVLISEKEKEELTSMVSPIVLLRLKKEITNDLALEQIAPRLSKVGVMLPYTPLLELIASGWGKPLIATSGNLSGSPIFYKDEDALRYLGAVADYFITHDREIVVPQDDSVIQFAGDQRMVMRRSRGLAPTYLPNPFAASGQTVLAAGSDMKSSFALLTKGNLYVSQYLGDLENYETQLTYQQVLNHFITLFHAKPTQVIIDKHPIYHSSVFGKQVAAQWETSLITVQHHLAHFSAVLAENELLRSEEKILGVIWDGTGWGDDDEVWGGEFFSFEKNNFQRVEHLEYVDHVMGDKTSREPRLSALSLCVNVPGAEEYVKHKFTSTEWDLYRSMLHQPGNLVTSSVGRLFDGVASLLGLCDKATFEGEAAMLLEACASNVTGKMIEPEFQDSFSLKRYLQTLLAGIQEEVPKEILAYRFHVTLVHWIEEIALREHTIHLAFSGGVFQNTLLNELIRQKLGGRYHLHFHRQLSCNDECIGFGQLAYAQIQMQPAGPVEIKLTTEMI